jgi:uncharacterized protein
MPDTLDRDHHTKFAVPDKLISPSGGVRLRDNLLEPAFVRNTAYLKSLSIDAILYWFRMRAGVSAPGEPYRGHFEDNIKGQTAGLFMMGAANSLMWHEDPELRELLEQVVTGIDECRDADGYLMAVPKERFGTGEYPNYVRVWLSLGLIATGQAGYPHALDMLRDWQDWFNQCGELSIVRYLVLAFQGIPASTTTYFSPVGKREDLDVAIDTYQEDWRLAQFILQQRDAVHTRHQHGSEPHAHGSEISAFEGYLDFYRATGNPIYLNAVLGAWELYRTDWQHVGGGIVMIEGEDMSPGCRWLDTERVYNELCVSAYWIYLNQRLHRLFPDDDRYIAEIEKSLYNVVLASQTGGYNIRYHAYIDSHKDTRWDHCAVTCCAGQGTRLCASLPEFLYTFGVDEDECDSISIDMYASSSLKWRCGEIPVGIDVDTEMPYSGSVGIAVHPDQATEFALRLRIPDWAVGATVHVNDCGKLHPDSGSYCVIQRRWSAGDTIEVGLPFAIRATRYEEAEHVDGYERYAYEYGPLLLGFVDDTASEANGTDVPGRTVINSDPVRPNQWLIADEKAAHFQVVGLPCVRVVPYFEIQDEPFTCYPLFKSVETSGA